uniref:Uncharacterized protein n=1 Tax=Sorghum bicolor TaxID=4558 RepID=C6JRI6_SORBI
MGESMSEDAETTRNLWRPRAKGPSTPPGRSYKHKIFIGPFTRNVPKAQIWVVPKQWRMTPHPTLPKSSRMWLLFRRIGPYVEVALYHKPSRHYW